VVVETCSGARAAAAGDAEAATPTAARASPTIVAAILVRSMVHQSFQGLGGFH
jgi:hypothetical protein